MFVPLLGLPRARWRGRGLLPILLGTAWEPPAFTAPEAN